MICNRPAARPAALLSRRPRAVGYSRMAPCAAPLRTAHNTASSAKAVTLAQTNARPSSAALERFAARPSRKVAVVPLAAAGDGPVATQASTRVVVVNQTQDTLTILLRWTLVDICTRTVGPSATVYLPCEYAWYDLYAFKDSVQVASRYNVYGGGSQWKLRKDDSGTHFDRYDQVAAGLQQQQAEHSHAPPPEFNVEVAKGVAAYSIVYGYWPPQAVPAATVVQTAGTPFDYALGPLRIAGIVDLDPPHCKVVVHVNVPWMGDVRIGDCDVGAGGQACAVGYKGILWASLAIEGCSLVCTGSVAGQSGRWVLASWCQ